MKILMVQPNYHSGGAEIAGNWTPSWVAYIGGALKQAGFDQVKFVDADYKYSHFVSILLYYCNTPGTRPAFLGDWALS